LAILVILTGHFWKLLQSTHIYGKWFNEDQPNGNPMRVEQTESQRETGFIDNMVEVFKGYYKSK
jgi:hypothetical protein